ncbi:hypothetical protein SDRG_01510 [Saprolegnia diclina VS20]|uniref:Uncharacterized protein n=1 Tax=Saprolegnia diclina (strain VS20) TaxID=1156394 RepID=T0S8G1_SAPDV|nr:hypothetical protein SDRG_01510 [Saprolegnia diclina VS20]EQC41548.1 hypothetical protein SDRG_01510 [Saprolegnia diclina VS20]|eukprot:XP_008605262.1 hypothetical protein SDRG_01510 [Saprolegnia diclina VS20]
MTPDHAKQKLVLGAWIEDSFARGHLRSVSESIVFCSEHIRGFSEKKPRSQRAWVLRAIRALDLEEFVKLNKPFKRPPVADLEREVSEILVKMHDGQESLPVSWCSPFVQVLHALASADAAQSQTTRTNRSGLDSLALPSLQPLAPHID